jgi:hypothetical protein
MLSSRSQDRMRNGPDPMTSFLSFIAFSEMIYEFTCVRRKGNDILGRDSRMIICLPEFSMLLICVKNDRLGDVGFWESRIRISEKMTSDGERGEPSEKRRPFFSVQMNSVPSKLHRSARSGSNEPSDDMRRRPLQNVARIFPDTTSVL